MTAEFEGLTVRYVFALALECDVRPARQDPRLKLFSRGFLFPATREMSWLTDPFLARFEACRAGDPSLDSSNLQHPSARKRQVRRECLSTEP